MSSIAAITWFHCVVPWPMAIIPLMPRDRRAEIHVGNDQQRPQILVPAVDKGDDEQRRQVGFDSGSTMSRKKRIGDAASIRAASISSSGRVIKTGGTGRSRSPRPSAAA